MIRKHILSPLFFFLIFSTLFSFVKPSLSQSKGGEIDEVGIDLEKSDFLDGVLEKLHSKKFLKNERGVQIYRLDDANFFPKSQLSFTKTDKMILATLETKPIKILIDSWFISYNHDEDQRDELIAGLILNGLVFIHATNKEN